MVTLKISTKKIIQRIGSILMFTIFFLFFAYFILPNFNNKTIGMMAILAIGTLPNLILLIEYIIYTIKIDYIEFNDAGFKVYYKNGSFNEYNYHDIRLIELYKAAGMDKGNYSFNSNEKFYFANIKTKGGKSIILTSLLGPDLSDALELIKNVPVDRTRTGYAFIFLTRVDPTGLSL